MKSYLLMTGGVLALSTIAFATADKGSSGSAATDPAGQAAADAATVLTPPNAGAAAATQAPAAPASTSPGSTASQLTGEDKNPVAAAEAKVATDLETSRRVVLTGKVDEGKAGAIVSVLNSRAEELIAGNKARSATLADFPTAKAS